MSLAVSIRRLTEQNKSFSLVLFCENYSEFLNSFYARTLNEEEMLQEGTIGHLILEQDIDQSDIEQLRKQSADLGAFLQKVLSAPNLPGAADTWFNQQVKNTKLANSLAAKMDLAQPENTLKRIKGLFGNNWNVPKALQAIALIDQQASAGLASFAEALALLARNLGDRIDGDTKLINVDPESGVTKEDIASGLQKAFQKSTNNSFSKRWKSLGRKLKTSKIPGAVISEFPVEEIMPQMMNLTMNDLRGLVDALPVKDIPPSPEAAVSDIENASIEDSGAKEESDDVTLSSDELGQAAQKWLDKLKADGADESLLNIGKKWIARVSKDAELANIVSGEVENVYESLNFNSLKFLISEQSKTVKWEDLVRLFSKNSPPEIGALPEDVLEPIIAPFAQALADVNVSVVDKNGKPFQPPKQDVSDAINDAEEAADENSEDESNDEEKPIKKDILSKIFSSIEDLKNPGGAVEKFLSLFNLKLEENKSWNLYSLLQEKVVKYEDLVSQLDAHFPEDQNLRAKAASQLRDALKDNLGGEYDISEIPELETSSNELSEKTKEDLRIYKDVLAPTGSFIRQAQNSATQEALSTAEVSQEIISLFLESDDVEELLTNEDFIKEQEKIVQANLFEKARTAAYASIFDSGPEIMQALSEEFGKEAAEKAAELWGKAQNAYEDLSPNKLKELMDIVQSARGGSAESSLALLKSLADLGAEGSIRQNLPEQLTNSIFDEKIEETEASSEVEVGEFYEYEDESGNKSFVKIVEEDPNEGVWQVVTTNEDGDEWKLDSERFAAQEEKFVGPIESSEIFPEATSLKKSEFNSKISSAFDSVYGDDEELLDLVIDYDDKVPEILAKVSEDLFSSDFSLEESLLKKRLLPFLFEGNYVWADVQNSIDRYSGDVPKDLLYALFAKAIPSFEELGVKVSGVPEVDIEVLKSSLSPEKEVDTVDPNDEIDIEDPEGISTEEEKKLDQEAEKVASAMGSIPIDKNKLASILKQYPDIVGKGQKATRARRKLRQAINIAAGMKVFAEEFDIGSFDKNKYVLTESKDYDPMARWKQLAGIKDD